MATTSSAPPPLIISDIRNLIQRGFLTQLLVDQGFSTSAPGATGVFIGANLAAFPGTGATDTIYVAIDTGLIYIWTGSYVNVGGEAVGAADWGDIGGDITDQTDLTDALLDLSTATSIEIADADADTLAAAEDYTDAEIGALTKTDVGLGNVDNTSNATERAATATLQNKTLTAPVLNGTMTGTGTLPATITMAAVPAQADNSNKIAPTAYVDALGLTKADKFADVPLTGANTLTAAAHAFRHLPFTGAGNIQTMGAGAEGAVVAVSHNGTGTNTFAGITVPSGYRATFEPGETGQVLYTGGSWRSLIPLVAAASSSPAIRLNETSWIAMPRPGDVTQQNLWGLSLTLLDSSTATSVSVTDQSSVLSTYTHKTRYTGAAAAISRMAGINGSVNIRMPTASVDHQQRLSYYGNAADANAAGQLFMGMSQTAPAFTASVEPSGMVNCIGLGYDSDMSQLVLFHNDATGPCDEVVLNGGAGFPANDPTQLYGLELMLKSVSGALSVDFTARNLITGVTHSGTITTNLPANTGTNLLTRMARGSANTATTPLMDYVALLAGRYCTF